MADIDMVKTHSLGQDAATTRCKEYLVDVADQFGLKLSWDGGVCTFSGPAKGKLVVKDDQVSVEVKLGLAAKMVKGTIAKKLDEGLNDALKA